MTFYAYIYRDPRDDVPFYVGKGQGRRARKHLVQTSNKGMRAMLNELATAGVEPVVAVYACDSETHALELERVLIEAYGRRIDGSGTLVNILEAGDRSGGFAGRKHSEESKAKIRAAMQARRLSDAHRARIGAANKGRDGPDESTQRKMIAARKAPIVRHKLSDAGKRTSKLRMRNGLGRYV